MPANRKRNASLPSPHGMTKDEAKTDGTIRHCLDNEGMEIDDNRRTHAYHTVRTYLPRPLLTSSYRHATTDIEEVLFRFRPTLSCRLSSACEPHIIPRPQVGGRAGSHRFARGGRRRNPPASNLFARSLTAFVRYRHDVCLLRDGRRDGTAEREARTSDGTGDGMRNGTS